LPFDGGRLVDQPTRPVGLDLAIQDRGRVADEGRDHAARCAVGQHERLRHPGVVGVAGGAVAHGPFVRGDTVVDAIRLDFALDARVVEPQGGQA
jgi:hypothetical protein